MRHSPPRSRGGCYGRLVLRGATINDSDEETESALFSSAATSGGGGFFGNRVKKMKRSASGVSGSQRNGGSVASSSSTVCVSGPDPNSFWAQLATCKAFLRSGAIFVLTNWIVSICIMVAGIGLSLGPGLHSLLVVEPPPTIDKSLNAFNIPNHVVTRRQDALEVAKHPPRRSRGKRDLRSPFDHPDSEFEEDSSNNLYIPSYHELLSRDIVRPLKSYFLDAAEPRVKVMDQSSGRAVVREVKQSTFKEVIRQSILNIQNSHDDDVDDPADTDETQLEEDLGGGDDDTISNRVKRDASGPPKVYGITQGFRTWKMQVVYLATESGTKEPNVFTVDNLAHINRVESAIRDHEGFTDFCYINYYRRKSDENLEAYEGCAPLNSLMTYFYPSKDWKGKIHYDGLGKTQEPIERTLKFAMTKDTFFWYVDDKINSTHMKSRLLRTEVQFGAPLAG